MNEGMAGVVSANGCGGADVLHIPFVRVRISETNTDVYEIANGNVACQNFIRSLRLGICHICLGLTSQSSHL